MDARKRAYAGTHNHGLWNMGLRFRGDDDKPAEHAESDIAIAALRGEAVTVQVGAVHVEPHLGALDVRIKALHQPPKPRRVVKLHQMAHLVRGKVVEHERGRENEPPRERQYARVRARAPTARLVAHADALDGDAELGRVAAARCLKIALRLAMTAQAHEINSFVENDLNDRGLARTAIEQRAQRHGSTLEQPRRKYCHMSKRAQHDGQQIKALPLAAGLVVTADHNSLGALKI